MNTPNNYSQNSSSQVQTYLAPSILVTLFCCLPLGIVAIIQAAQVNSKLSVGDYEGALAASNKAKKLCWWSFGLGLVWIVGIWGSLIGMGILSNSTDRDSTQDSTNESQYIESIDRQLQSIEQRSGHKMLRTPYIGRLPQGTHVERNLLLNSRTPYSFVGVCDNDCLDLDLELYNENGNLIGKDVLEDV